MVVDAVYARYEKSVQHPLVVQRSLAEMLVQPCTRLGGNVPAARDVRRRRCELRYEDVAVVAPEHLSLGTVRKRVEVKQVCRRTMRLVARADAARMTPFDPLRENVVDDQVRKRFAVVALYPRHRIRVALPAGERIPVVSQVVAALRLERLKKARRPPCFVIFEGIVVHPRGTQHLSFTW